jgi:acyl carrier protein
MVVSMNERNSKQRLRAIWSEVLHGVPIDDWDHFLDKGGDSIAAVQCVTAVLSEFGIEIPLHLLFLEETTFEAFVEAVMCEMGTNGSNT